MKKFAAALLLGLVVALVANVYAADKDKAATTKPTSTATATATAPMTK